MARSINAPGIEINEIDRSRYDDTVDNSTIGTATLVLGFTDKGEDYTTRWINSINTFVKIYGQPTNEAERYMYNTVFEILDRGGVCYASKLPYFNSSKDNFTYTSYTISKQAQYLSSVSDILIPKHDKETILSGRVTIFSNNLLEIAGTIKNIVKELSVTYIKPDELLNYSQLSDGFDDIYSKNLFEMNEAVGQLYTFFGKTIPPFITSPIDFENEIKALFNIKYLMSSVSLEDIIFKSYELSSSSFWKNLEYGNAEDGIDLPKKFVDYVINMLNITTDEQDNIYEKIFKINVDYREALIYFQDMIDGKDIGLGDSKDYIQEQFRMVFGYGTTSEDILKTFLKTVYLYECEECIHEISAKTTPSFPDFDGLEELLKTDYTEARMIDDSLKTLAEISSDTPFKNEIMSFSDYDKFLVKELRVPLNKIYIVDLTRGKYEVDQFGNEFIGILPVIVTPTNAFYVQELMENTERMMHKYNAVSQVRNSYRKNGTVTYKGSITPCNKNDKKLKHYPFGDESNFAGFVEYIGGEGQLQTSDQSLSRTASETFPTLKFINDMLDRKYLQQIGIVVFKVYKDTANENSISFLPVETFVGSLDRYAKDIDTGQRTFIDDVVNGNSDYINVFSNANIGEPVDNNPLGLKNASIFSIRDQVACSMGFYQMDTWKNIHVMDSIYSPMMKIFQKCQDRNNLEIDLIVDGGVSNIAQFIASTQLYDRKPDDNSEDKTKYIKDEFSRYGIFDTQSDSQYLFKMDNQRQILVWKKVIQRFDEFCKITRKDCMFIADGPRPLCLDGNFKVIRRTKPGKTVGNTIIPKMKLISGNINSSYSAGYLNWFWSIDHSTGNYMWMPPSIKALGVYLYTDSRGAYWDAPAGMNRGVLRGTLDVAFNPTNEEAGQIYINSWNYAVSYPLNGIVLEGQKTFQRDKTALDRVNVRRLMLGLENTIRGYCKYFNYEGNTEFQRSRIQDVIERYLEQVKVNDGISQYIVVCDERNNTEQTIENNELHIAIAVRPIKTIEFIVLNFIATNQSVDVSEAVTAGI